MLCLLCWTVQSRVIFISGHLVTCLFVCIQLDCITYSHIVQGQTIQISWKLPLRCFHEETAAKSNWLTNIHDYSSLTASGLRNWQCTPWYTNTNIPPNKTQSGLNTLHSLHRHRYCFTTNMSHSQGKLINLRYLEEVPHRAVSTWSTLPQHMVQYSMCTHLSQLVTHNASAQTELI